MTSVINRIIDMKKEHKKILKELKIKVEKSDDTTNEPKRYKLRGRPAVLVPIQNEGGKT